MASVKELAYAVYEVSSLADWEHFGASLLGLQVAESNASRLTLRTDQKAHRWICVPGTADDVTATGYEVGSDAELDELIGQLRAAGAPVAEGSAELAAERKVDRVVITADPLGYRLELVVNLHDADTPFESKVMLGGFVTGAGGAGHQVLIDHGHDRKPVLDFYTGVLGFKISDFIDEELAPGFTASVAFLHCNGRHHTLALANMPFPKKTHHIMCEVRDIRDVGLAYDRCMDARQPFEMTLGMHPNDKMFSFYVRTPSGFNVEYGWGGLVIDDATWQVQHLDKLSSWGHRPPQVVAGLLGAGS